MIAAILGTFLGVLVLFFAAMWVGINTPEPAGAHHKPPRPTWRHRRQAERSRDEATERLFAGMQVPPEIARDATHTDDDSCGRCGWHTEAGTAAGRAAELRQHLGKHAAAMSTGIWHYESLSAEQAQARGWTEPDGPLMPLPPEVVHAEPDGILRHDGPDLTAEQVEDFRARFAATREREEQEAIARLRKVTQRLAKHLAEIAEPEDPHDVATDDAQADALVGAVRPDPEMDYRDETGTWPALVDAVMPKDGPEIIPVRPH